MSLINRTKAILGLLKVEPIKDLQDLLATCQLYAAKQIARDAKKIQLDALIQGIKDQHEGEIEALNSQLSHELKRIRAWADLNREREFGDRQSFVIAGHELAFRKSPGAIGFTEGHDAESVVEAILSMEGEAGDKLREQVLRVKAELDKKAAMRLMRLNEPDGAGKLRDLGVCVDEDESFDFTPAREALPEITETAAAQPLEKAAA